MSLLLCTYSSLNLRAIVLQVCCVMVLRPLPRKMRCREWSGLVDPLTRKSVIHLVFPNRRLPHPFRQKRPRVCYFCLGALVLCSRIVRRVMGRRLSFATFSLFSPVMTPLAV